MHDEFAWIQVVDNTNPKSVNFEFVDRGYSMITWTVFPNQNNHGWQIKAIFILIELQTLLQAIVSCFAYTDNNVVKVFIEHGGCTSLQHSS